MNLDLGCGKNKTKGAIGFDIDRDSDADVIGNIEHGLLFKDATFDSIYCKDFIEHCANIVMVMREINRIIKPGGRLTIICPFYHSVAAVADPTHKHYLTPSAIVEYFCVGGNMRRIGKTNFILESQCLIFNKRLEFLPFKEKLIHFIPNLCLGFELILRREDENTN